MQRPQKYTHTLRYGNQRIDFNFWLLQEDGLAPDTVIFLGAGQVDSIPRRVSLAAGSGIVVVEGLPHWRAHPSVRIRHNSQRRMCRLLFETVQQIFGVRELNVIAESQAAPASVIMICNLPNSVRNVALARPLGFTAQAFGSSEQARLKVFRRRLIRTALQLIYQPRNIAIGIIMVRAMLREPSFTALNKKYAVGISYDLLQDYQQAAKLQRDKGHRLALLLGEKDRLFPPQEVLAALKTLHIEEATVRIVPKIGHASFATPSSKAILHQAINIVREKWQLLVAHIPYRIAPHVRG